MDNLLELDESDKKRINENISTLKEKNIPYLQYMVKIPLNSLTQIKSKEEIIDKMLVDFIISIVSKYMTKNSVFMVDSFLARINKKYNTDKLLSIQDKALIINIINNLYTANELEEYCILIERVNVLLWSLNLVDKIDSYNKCNLDIIYDIIMNFKNYDDLLKNTKVRSKEEILSKADLLTRYFWALRDIREEDSTLDKLNEKIVDIQNETFEFLTSYTYNSLSKNKIKIECNKDDLSFSFEIPTSLNFERVSETSKELLALKSNDSTTRIVMQDFGRIKKEEFDVKINKNKNTFIKNGFSLLGDYKLYSTVLKEKIVRIVIRKGNISLNVYYIFVSNHLIRIDSLIESYIDSSNYDEIIFSKNTNIDLDMIFSINEEIN